MQMHPVFHGLKFEAVSPASECLELLRSAWRKNHRRSQRCVLLLLKWNGGISILTGRLKECHLKHFKEISICNTRKHADFLPKKVPALSVSLWLRCLFDVEWPTSQADAGGSVTLCDEKVEDLP